MLQTRYKLMDMSHLPTRFLTILLMTAALALGACGSSNTTGEQLADIVKAERGTSSAPDKCMVPSDLVGKPHTELAKMKFKVPVRVIFPGTTVSGDQVSNRLNFKVDKKGIIRGITCG